MVNIYPLPPRTLRGFCETQPRICIVQSLEDRSSHLTSPQVNPMVGNEPISFVAPSLSGQGTTHGSVEACIYGNMHVRHFSWGPPWVGWGAGLKSILKQWMHHRTACMDSSNAFSTYHGYSNATNRPSMLFECAWGRRLQ